MKLRVKTILLLVFILVVFTSGIFFLLFQETKKVITRQAVNELEALANAKKLEVNSLASAYIDILNSISSRTKMRTTLQEYITESNGEAVSTILNILEDAKEPFKQVHSLAILDPTGELVVSTDAFSVMPNNVYETLSQAVTQEIFFFDRDTEEIIVAGPILRNEQFLGVLVAEFSDAGLDAIVSDYTGLGETGEVLIADRDEVGDAYFLHTRRFENVESAVSFVDKTALHVPITQALLGNEQIMEDAIDYRGVPVIAATRYSPELDWGLVIKIDKEELFHPLTELIIFLAKVLILGTVFVGVLIYFASGSVLYPIELLTKGLNNIVKGEFKFAVSEKMRRRKDEIGTLTNSFLYMLKSLRGSYSELEQKVQDRTSQLTDALHATKSQNRELEEVKSALSNLVEDIEIEKRKLETAKAKDEAILASIGEGLVITDKERKVIFVNKAAETMLQRSANELSGNVWPESFFNLYNTEGKVIPIEEIPIIHSLASDSGNTIVSSTDYLYTRKDGLRFPVAITTSPFSVGDELQGVIVVFRDVTREKEVDRQKSEFVSVASHQLRTPLTGIQWVTERMLKRKDLPDGMKEYLEDIHLSSERLATLVDLLLNVSRIEEGRVSISPKAFDFVGFVYSYLEEIQPLLDKKALTLTFDNYPHKLWVKSDTSVVRNIVQSLISNSLEYTPEKGSITLSIDHDDTKLKFMVKDTGIGIPKDEQSNIFNKFKRAQNAQLVKTDGTGLGLYIAKEAVELLGGKIWFESEENKGTTFFIELPLESKSVEGDKGLA